MAQLNDLLVLGMSNLLGAVNIFGDITAPNFIGSGASLTSLNASNITSGTLAAARLAASGVTAGSYGPSANAAPAHGGTFTVPYVTVDTYGRVTGAANKTITIPAVPSTVSRSQYLETWYTDKSKTYGSQYPIYAWWETSSVCKLTVDNYTTKVDQAVAFASKASVALTGDVTGSASSTHGWSITTTLANSGVTAGSYGPTANSSPAHGGTFNVPQITFDAKGRATSAATRTITLPSDRLFVTLVPTGTAIPANANLNTPTYMKVGRYYCSQTATAKTITNCPVDVAFMMEVYSPLSTNIDNETTGTWVYRIRKITAYNTGVTYIQYANVGGTANTWTYDKWHVIPRSPFTLDTTDNNGGSAALGSITRPVYLKADGTFAPCAYHLEKDVPEDAVFTDHTYTAGTALTLTGSTFSVSQANVSTMMNLLGEGTSPAELDDYLIAQYAGGGTTTTTYHRRKVRNVVNATVVKAALGTGTGTTKYLREDGTWVVPTNTNYYHTPTYSAGLKIATGTGVNDMYVPTGTTSSLGVVKQHGADDCTSYTSDEGATTPKAVKKAFGLFGTFYGVCGTAAATKAKAVTVTPDTFVLQTGAQVTVKFTYANTATAPTLNVNGTGAKNIMIATNVAAGSTPAVNGWPAGAMVTFTYDGTSWVKDFWTNNNTTYSAGNGLTLSSTTFNIGAGTGISVAADTVSFNPAGTASSYDATLSYRPSVLSTTAGTAPSGPGMIIWYCS